MEQNKESRNGPSTLWSTHFQQSRKEYPMKKDSLFNKQCWENWTATCRRMKLDHFLIKSHRMGVGKIAVTFRRMELDHSLTPHTKINSKWMKDLNVRQESIKILEENTGSINPSCSNFLLDTSPKERQTKAKMNYWDLSG